MARVGLTSRLPPTAISGIPPKRGRDAGFSRDSVCVACALSNGLMCMMLVVVMAATAAYHKLNWFAQLLDSNVSNIVGDASQCKAMLTGVAGPGQLQ